nr:DinB family protein [candidate division Zixibacteria bacterium]
MADKNVLLELQINFWRDNIRNSIMEALELMPEDKGDWIPADNMIPLGQLFLHICETSDWWYDEIMKGNKAVELAVPGEKCPDKKVIKNHLEEHWKRLERFFAEPKEAFEKTYKREGSHEGRKWKIEQTGYWIFTHLFEHDIHHRSQINHYLRILGIRPPRI